MQNGVQIVMQMIILCTKYVDLSCKMPHTLDSAGRAALMKLSWDPHNVQDEPMCYHNDYSGVPHTECQHSARVKSDST